MRIEGKRENDRGSDGVSPTAACSANFQVHATKKKLATQHLDLHFVLSAKVIFLVSDGGSGEVLKSENTATFRIANLANVSCTHNSKKCDIYLI